LSVWQQTEAMPIPFNQPFTVGGVQMMFPHSPGAPAGEVVNCRCYYNSYYVGETRPDGSIIQPPTAVQPVAVPEASPQVEFNPSVTFDSEADLQASYLASLSEPEIKTVKNYQFNLFQPVNDAMRGKAPITQEVQEHVNNLDRAIGNAPPLSADAVVYRGLKTGLDFDVGDVFSDAGFSSTSLESALARTFASKKGEIYTQIEIRLPKGSKGLVMRTGSASFDNEKEVLLPRNSSFRVISRTVSKLDGIKLVVELIQ
jgi:hypothetical protein